MNKKREREIIEKWISENGAAQFDTKNRELLFNDGGFFYIEKKVKIKTKNKIIFSKTPEFMEWNGHKHKVFPLLFKKMKRNGKHVKEKVENYSAHLWFEDIDDTIEYFKRVKKLLNKLGYRTSFRLKRLNKKGKK